MNFESGSVKLTVSDDMLLATVYGEIDHHCAKNIREAIDSALLSYSPDALVMDLSGITFMDSSGLGLVMGRYTKTKDAGITFTLCGASDRVIKMLDMAGLDRIIDYKELKK